MNDFIFSSLVFYIQIVLTLQFDGYSPRNDPSTVSMLSSAFEQAGLTFKDLNPNIPDNLGPTYISNNHYPQLDHLLQSPSTLPSSASSPSSPKSSLFWRLRYPFRSLKETNRALFARAQPQLSSPPSPSSNFHSVIAVPKPVKFDADDETEFGGGGGLLGNYRRPRLNFPGVYGFQSSEHGLNNGKKQPHLLTQSVIHRPSHHPPSPSGHLSSASSLQTPIFFNQNRHKPQQKNQHPNQIENILIKPLPSNDALEAHKARDPKQASASSSSPTMASSESDMGTIKLYNKLTSEKYGDDKHDKFKFIRYDYSGFKPMGPASTSQLLSSTYPINANEVITSSSSAPNGTIDFGKSSSNYRDPKYYSFLDTNSNNHIDGGGGANYADDLDDEMSENSMETFSSRLSIFHPEKVEPDNKMILPIAPTDLLRLVSEETRSKGKPIECANKDLGWCDLGDQYPTDFVESIIRRCQRSVDRMYVEVPANLQDYSDYKPFKPINNNGSTDSLYNDSFSTPSTTTSTSSSSSFDINDWSSSEKWSKSSDAPCDSDKKFIRPIIAQDINGSWYLIAQTNQYHQQIPVQICSLPGSSCNYNKYGKCSSSSSLKSRCVQKFYTQLLISIDIDKDKECPMMKLYRFPSSCNCQSTS